MGKMLEQQSKVATAAQASADKLLIRAKNMKDRFTTFKTKGKATGNCKTSSKGEGGCKGKGMQ